MGKTVLRSMLYRKQLLRKRKRQLAFELPNLRVLKSTVMRKDSLLSWRFFGVICKVRVAGRESLTEVETENDGGGVEGNRQSEKPPAINSPLILRFLKLRPKGGRSKRHLFLIGRQNVNLSADVRFPEDTNFKGVPSFIMQLT